MKRTNKSTVNTAKSSFISKVARAVKVSKPSANLHKVSNQTQFLEQYLRGTGRTLSSAQASANYGIKNLAARMSDFRAAGLKVETKVNSTGKTAYRVSARDVNGSRASKFAI